MKEILVTYQTLVSGLIGTLVAYIIFYLKSKSEKEKSKYERRLYIFRTLLSNIQNIVSIDFVSAFNLIMVEYKDEKKVIEWRNKFIQHVALSEDERTRPNRIQEFDGIVIKLIEEVGKSIDIKMEQLDIQNKVYWPQGFNQTAETQRKLTTLLIETQEQWKEILSKAKSKKIKIEIEK